MMFNSAKNNKIFRNNLTKEMKDVYTENFKTLMKKIEDTNKQKNIRCLWIRRINIIKCPCHPKLSMDLM